MKKYLFLLLLGTIVLGSVSCSEDDTPSPPLNILDNLNESSSKKVFSYNGMEMDGKGISFKILNVINENNGITSEADLEMTLPASVRISTTTATYAPFKFQVRAVSTEDRVTFSGDCLENMGDTKLSVEGIFQKSRSSWDTLRVNMKRESPQASFAGRTYELTLNENTLIQSDFDDNEGTVFPPTLAKNIKAGLDSYMNYLRDKTHEAVYRFTFQENGTLEIQKRNSQQTNFEKLEGHFTYFIADKEIGFIEMKRSYADELVTLLIGEPDMTIFGLFETTYLFNPDEVVTLPFAFRYSELGDLCLALGDKTGFRNIKYILFSWRENAPSYYNKEESDPLLELFITWDERRNYGDQLWWRLEEK